MNASNATQRPAQNRWGTITPRPAAPQFRGKYLSLTTSKDHGTGVATPVWFVTEPGKILIVTGAESYKVRQIRRHPSVTAAECTASSLRAARRSAGPGASLADDLAAQRGLGRGSVSSAQITTKNSSSEMRTGKSS